MEKTRKMLVILGFMALIALFATALTINLMEDREEVRENPLNEGDKNYIGNSKEECSLIKFMCTEGYEPFFDEKGCGCQKIKEDVKPERVFCEESQRNVDVCTMEYRPVCGWFNPEKVQCIKYPCAQTISNPCFACSNPDVLYWTEGECPL